MLVSLSDFHSFLRNAIESQDVIFYHTRTVSESVSNTGGKIEAFKETERRGRDIYECYKLSVREIIQVTDRLVKATSPEITKDAEDYAKTVSEVTAQTFREETLDPFQELKGTLTDLKKFYQVRVVDRYAAKWKEGFFGKIQWLIFSLLYDQSKEIERMQQEIKKETVFAPAVKVLKINLHYAIEDFYTIEKITRDQGVKFSKEKERFPGDAITSKKIKQLWLTKFASDKYDRTHQNLSEKAKNIRTKIIELNQYLEILE